MKKIVLKKAVTGSNDRARQLAFFLAAVIATLLIGSAVIIIKHPDTEILTGHTDYTGPFGPITASNSVVEKLDVERRKQTLTEISLFMGTFGRVNDCEVDFAVYKNGEEVYSYVIENAETMEDNAYVTLRDINVECGQYDELYLLITSPDADEENAVTVALDKKDRDRSVYSYNSQDGSAKEKRGALCVSITCRDNTLFVFSVIVFVLIVVSGAVILFVWLFTDTQIHKVAALAALLYGLLYMVVITPHSPPDEYYHYRMSYKLSNYLMLRWDKAEYAESDDFDFLGLPAHVNSTSAYLWVINDFNLPDTDKSEDQFLKGVSLDYFPEYLAQAAGVALARLANQNVIRTFLAGRLFNLLLYTACVYFAVKRAPRFKLLLGLISIMPMSLHQAASYSYDCFVNGMSLLLISCILKGIFEKGPLSRSDFCWMLAVSMLLTPAKVVYVCIVPLVLLIPAERYSGRRQKLIRSGAVLILCAAMMAAFQYSALMMRTTSEMSHVSGWDSFDIFYILHNPLTTAYMFLKSISEMMVDWLRGAIGASLSGLSLSIPSWIVSIYTLLLFTATIQVQDTGRALLLRERAAFFLVSAVVVLLTMLSMFLGWTSATSQVVVGVQGRYFIPVLPLMYMCLNNSNIFMKKPVDKLCLSSAAVLQMFTLAYVVFYTCKAL